MKRYLTLLFYYSGALSTLLVLELLFSFPSPQGLILSLLFLPIPLYFALRIGTEPAPIRLFAGIVTGIVIIAASSFTHMSIKTMHNQTVNTPIEPEKEISQELHALKEKHAQTQESEETIIKELGSLKEEIASLRKELSKRNNILGNMTSLTTPVGFVMVKENLQQDLEVFEKNNPSSKTIGKALPGKTYPYFQKAGNYYYIELSYSTAGWIDAQFVKETAE